MSDIPPGPPGPPGSPDPRTGGKKAPLAGLVIRAALATERAAACRLLTARLVEHGLAVDADGVARAVELALSQGSSAWLVVALSSGLPAGIALANPVVSAAAGGAALWVEELYVPPEKRRRGVARALVEFLVREARDNGMRSVEIETPAAGGAVAAGAGGDAVLSALGFAPLARHRYSRVI